MISILIPTYNYSVVTLVNVLHKQVQTAEILYEIIVCDDASTDLSIVKENKSIKNLECCTLIKNTTNLGRTQTRQKLAETAKYNWLLFLDADVMPKYDTFINDYVANISNEIDLIFGGICYEEHKPEIHKMLRWKYGISREKIPLEKRKKKPTLTINSGCFLIKKKIFLSVNSKMNYSGYGMDLMFQHLLFQNRNTILHIDNPVIHLGLESNAEFIKKSLKAIETTVYLEKQMQINTPIKPLQKAYKRLKKNHLVYIFKNCFKPFKNLVKRNLLSKNPSLFLFDIYRLYHYTNLK